MKVIISIIWLFAAMIWLHNAIVNSNILFGVFSLIGFILCIYYANEFGKQLNSR